MLGVELPAGGAAALADEATGAFGDAWPIFVAVAGVGLTLAVLRKFIRI